MKFFKNNHIINTKFWELLLPTILMATANNLTVFVDSVITSRLCGDDRLAAIQIAAPFESLVSLIIWTIGIGGSLICFEKKANNKSKEGDHVFTISICAVLMIATILCLLVELFKMPILAALCPDARIGAITNKYLSVQALTYIPAAYIMGMAYFTRADDRAMLSFVALLTSNIVNLFMDFVFIKGLGLDIQGASLATLTGHIVGSFITTIYFLRGKRTLYFTSIKGCAIFKSLRDVMMRGFPASAMQLYVLGRYIIANRVITELSSVALIAFSIFNSSMFIPSILYVGLAQTMSPLVSFFHQEKDYSSVRHVAKKALILVISITVVMALVVFIFPNILTGLFNTRAMRDYKVVFSALRILPLSYIGTGVVFILTFYLQAVCDLKMANIISFLDGFAISSLLVVVLSKLFGVNGCWVAIAVSPFISILVYTLYAFRNGHNFFLLPSIEQSVFMDLSINVNPEAVAELSRSVEKRFIGGQLSNDAQTIARAIEEMVCNITCHDPSVKSIDFAIRREGNKIIISIRNTGKEYNPLVEQDNVPSNNIAALINVCHDINYCRVTGINCTTISIKL